MRQQQWHAMAVTLAAVLAAFVLLLIMPSAARGLGAATPPLSVSNFVIIDPNGNLTVHGGPVTLAQGSGQHVFVFDTMGYRFSVINTSKVLVPGHYSTAIDTWLSLVNDPACNYGTTVGEAQIDQATYDQAGSVTSAAVQFQFRCWTGTYVYGTIAYQLPKPDPPSGSYFDAPDGGLWGFGNESYLTYLGTPYTQALGANIAGMAVMPDGGGYLMAGTDGGVFAYGDAQFHGSMGGMRLSAPVVGIATTPDGNGYWEVASDGGVFAFGDAQFHGSMGGTRLSAPVVGMAATSDGNGYWEVASDGGVFAFGDAQFHGSMGGKTLHAPIVGIAPSPTGGGYREGASDGGVFAFGDALFEGNGLSVISQSAPAGFVPG